MEKEKSRNTESKERQLLGFLHCVSKLKHLDRQGWIRNGINRPETVAGHMYRMAIMSAFAIKDSRLDLNKCMKMSIVHDIGESKIGDITPHDGVAESTKQRIEDDAVSCIAKMLEGGQGTEMYNLFREYEEGNTLEAKLVHDLDKLDMVIQAYEYELSEKKPKFLQEFFNSTSDFFNREECHSEVKALHCQLLRDRENGVGFFE